MYHILVCDDDKAILDSVEIYLNLEGYHTIRAMNGQEALKAVENTEIHCAILGYYDAEYRWPYRNA